VIDVSARVFSGDFLHPAAEFVGSPLARPGGTDVGW
jgi:hypothetical protein